MRPPTELEALVVFAAAHVVARRSLRWLGRSRPSAAAVAGYRRRYGADSPTAN